MADKRFVGLWRLVSLERQGPDGKPEYPFGQDPVGIIGYHPTGHMSVHIMRRNRPRFAGRQGTTEEMVAAYQSFTAYFGTYEVNDRDGAVIHHVQGASSPMTVGIPQKRLFSFSGNRLTLRPAATPENPAPTTKVVWERIA